MALVPVNPLNTPVDGTTTISVDDLNDLIEPLIASQEALDENLSATEANALSITDPGPALESMHTTGAGKTVIEDIIPKFNFNEQVQEPTFVQETSITLPDSLYSDLPSRIVGTFAGVTGQWVNLNPLVNTPMTFNDLSSTATRIYPTRAGHRFTEANVGITQVKRDPNWSWPQSMGIVYQWGPNRDYLEYKTYLLWTHISNHYWNYVNNVWVGDWIHYIPGHYDKSAAINGDGTIAAQIILWSEPK